MNFLVAVGTKAGLGLDKVAVEELSWRHQWCLHVKARHELYRQARRRLCHYCCRVLARCFFTKPQARTNYHALNPKPKTLKSTPLAECSNFRLESASLRAGTGVGPRDVREATQNRTQRLKVC